MHILVIPSWYQTRVYPLNGVFFREQALELMRAGHRVGVVAPNQYSIFVAGRNLGHRYRMRVVDDEGLATYSSYTCGMFSMLPWGNTVGWLRHGMALFERYLADQGRPDVIQVHAAFQAGLLAERIKRRWGIPYVLSEHSSMYLEDRVARWKRGPVRRAYAAADARTAVSPRLGEAIERYFGQAVRPWTWIPNMVDARFFAGSLPRGRGSDGRFRLLHVAHLNPIKAQDVLLRAFAARFRGERSVELRIGGDGPMLRRLGRMAGALGVGEQVRFLGALSRDQVVHEMTTADAFVLCSRFETFSLVTAESLACGTPVIATSCGGPEAIVDEASGMLVPPGDAAALGRAMAEMRERSARYDPAELRRRCAARFSREAVVSRWEAVYDAVLAGRGSRGGAVRA